MLDQLRAMLEEDEGRVPHVYRDSLGYWTIGVGHLVDERKGGGLPDSIIDALLDYDIREKLEELDRRLPWWRSQPESVQLALANMAFQLGVSGLLGFRRMLAALEEEDRQRARREALNSRWATQTPDRARRVADLIGGDR